MAALLGLAGGQFHFPHAVGAAADNSRGFFGCGGLRTPGEIEAAEMRGANRDQGSCEIAG